MKTYKNITVTEGRTNEVVQNVVKKAITPTINDAVKNAVEKERIRTGIITKFYPYLDKAEVKIDNSKEKVLCKILHRFGGDIIDFYTPLDNEESFDEALGEPCVIPRSNQHVCILRINDADSVENIILGYYQNEDIVGFKPAPPGNMKLMSLIETNPYWIQFGIDGLNLRLPHDPEIEVGDLPATMENHDIYTKDEVDERIKEDGGLDYLEILEAIEQYKQTTETRYTLFRNDLWTVNFNYEAIASITSDGDDDLTINGVFRTTHDMVGLYWNSKDLITHPYISYGERSDYRDVVLEFDYEMDGCIDFSDWIISITVAGNNGEIYYVPMPQFIDEGHFRLDFNELKQEIGQSWRDVNGDIHQREEEFKLPVHDLKYLLFVLIPEEYSEEHPDYVIMENVEFECRITNIQVTNDTISYEHKILEPHGYRLCEGYDDFYNLNPLRVVKEMRKLGYTEWVDLYIGASHFYEKSGTIGDVVDISVGFDHVRTEKMTVDTSKPLNIAFSTWLDHYARALKEHDCPNLIISVSMENLQAPKSWRQKHSQPIIDEHASDPHPITYAETGWKPSTFFYAPTNDEVIEYIKDVSRECLDILVDNDMQPILQLGEAWWWWQEGYPEAVTDDVINWEKFPGQPPTFYDDVTLAKFEAEFGRPLTVYTNSWVNDYDKREMDWINQQIVKYSDELRKVAKSYENGLYMALFFPPFVTDVDRVPPMMQQVNYLKDAFHPSKLDVLQLEDYDWVTTNDPHHKEVYDIGEDLGFPVNRVDYFGGYVQYHRDAPQSWRLIKTAMDDAVKKDFREVYAWSGSQIRRDNKILGYDKFELVQHLLYEDTLKG